jgi:hypothetical protein
MDNLSPIHIDQSQGNKFTTSLSDLSQRKINRSNVNLGSADLDEVNMKTFSKEHFSIISALEHDL